MTIEELRQVQKYSNEILEIIELQVQNTDESLTQSDLQGVIDAIVHKIMIEAKK